MATPEIYKTPSHYEICKVGSELTDLGKYVCIFHCYLILGKNCFVPFHDRVNYVEIKHLQLDFISKSDH